MMRFCYCMILLLLMCAILLPACLPSGEPVKSEETAETQSTGPSGTESQTESAAHPAEDVSYTIALDASLPIFDGPGYDNVYVRTVGEDGVFTIIEEDADGEGNVWGKLKSGIGWVDLTYVRAFSENPPLITVSFLENVLSDMDDYHLYIAEDSAYTQKLLFRARETLHDVQFVSLTFGDASYEKNALLYSLDTMTPESPFVLGVVFHGDMTTYGVTFTDSTGTVHRYAIYISGRNGMLISVLY